MCIEDLKTIQESCPPLGHPDERFKVTVLGTLSPAVGGCASMMKYRHDIVPGFNLWLGDAKTGGGSCDDEGTYNEYYILLQYNGEGADSALHRKSSPRLKSCVR